MPARILVIEDNPDNLELMKYLLTAFGHTVIAARDGEEGIEVAKRELPDLVLSDLQMPKVGGFEVLRELRQDPRFSTCPLVAVTSYAMRGDREQAIAAGFNGYISKPIEPESFVEEVERFLRADLWSAAKPDAGVESQAATGTEYHSTILAVDNSPTNLSLLHAILSPFGYRIVRAGSAAEGIRKALAAPPDLILSDLHMPDMDGCVFFETLQKEPRLRDIPFVIISSTLWPHGDLGRVMASGVRTFITRPIEPSELLARIEECLSPTKQR